MLLVVITLSSTPGCISPWPHWVRAPSPLDASGNVLVQQNGEHWFLPILGFQARFLLCASSISTPVLVSDTHRGHQHWAFDLKCVFLSQVHTENPDRPESGQHR